MEAFIQHVTSISPFKVSGSDAPEGLVVVPDSGYFSALEPAYTQYIPGGELRRMSRLVKMGLYAALQCVKESDVQVDAITIGTGLGGFESFEKFEQSIETNQELTLSPTPFIQSLHNAVSGQIALHLKCYGYNMTYVHRGFSFETALLDALLLLQEQEDLKNLLVGGLDELTPNYVKMLRQAGHVRPNAAEYTAVQASKAAGVIPGEGAAFLLLSPRKTSQSLGVIKGLKTLFQPQEPAELAAAIRALLAGEEGGSVATIDLVLLGHSGDAAADRKLVELENQLFPAHPKVYFKNYCGEYQTSTAFAVWLSTQLLRDSSGFPEIPRGVTPKNILIVNHYRDTHYSFVWIAQG